MPIQSVIKNSSQIKKLLSKNRHLFWWIKPSEIENIDTELLVESVLNYGDKQAVKELFNIVGARKVANIFHKQTSRKRHNYYPQVVNFFDLYFQQHA